MTAAPTPGGMVVRDPFSHDRLPLPHHEREVREKGGREKKVTPGHTVGGEERLAVCMSGAVR